MEAEPKRKRRWFQFSLRSLLIGVTLLAVACWVIVDRTRLIREREEARQAEIQARRSEERTRRLLNYQIADPPARRSPSG
jgi:hypothetical protein